MRTSVSISRQRIVSLWLRRISTDRHARQHPSDPRPLAITGRRGNAETVVAIDATAESLGLYAGLSLAEARAMHPGIAVAAEDLAADTQVLEKMADWCRRYTPLAALEAPDGILLDIAGCAHLFGGEAAMIDDMLARIASFGFTAHAGIAATIGAAWAASHYAVHQPVFVRAGGEAVFLDPLPLKALRLDDETVAALRRVGFKRIGDVAAQPRAPLAARFGGILLRQLDRALGREREPLTPRLPVAPYVAEQRFPEPIAREEDVFVTVERLARRLSAILERRGEGLRRVTLELFRTDGEVRRIEAGTSRSVRDPAELRALFTERLAALADPVDPGFGFDLARLSVTAAEAAPPQQAALDDHFDDDEIGRLTDRLSARLGACRVTRLVAQDGHMPELAAATVPAQAAPENRGWEAFRRFSTATGLNVRPLRLLVRPESIEAMASIPDGPPLRFRWRRALHEVTAAEGPERIEGVWWSEAAENAYANLARDYFRVEDSSGCRFWIFRAGLYRDTATPSWFMHGLFA